MSAKAQLRYNKELGRSRRGRSRGVREVRKVRKVTPEVEREVQEVREESEEEDDGVRMVHVIDENLDEVWRKVERTDVMVRALVRKEIGKGRRRCWRGS